MARRQRAPRGLAPDQAAPASARDFALIRRRWRAVAPALAVGGALLAVAIAAVPGGTDFLHVARYVAQGSTLTGKDAVYNISIAGVAERFNVVPLGWAARLLVLLLAAAVLYAWVRRPAGQGGIAAAGTLLLTVSLLAGNLSEDHYLVVVTPCLLLTIALQRQVSGLWIALPALLLAAFPRYYVGSPGDSVGDLQIRYFLAEIFIVAAAVVTLLPWAARRARMVPPAAEPAPTVTR
jgi:hypothetical protein